MKHQIKIGTHSLELDVTREKITNHEGEVAFTVIRKDEKEAVIQLNNKIFTIRIISEDEDGKTVKASINGKTTHAEIKNQTDLLLEKMGGNGASSASAKNIKAPMPGLIVKINSKIGQPVEKGDVLLNFEAMKMENQLKSPGKGIIKNILVKEGDKIEKGQLLIEME